VQQTVNRTNLKAQA